MRWTTEPPRCSGYYWYSPEPGSIRIVLIYEPYEDGELWLYHAIMRPVKAMKGRWSGPIEEPEEE